MGQCKWCGKSGIFLSLSEKGLCNNCHTFITADISLRTRQINESVSIMEKTKNIDVMVSRFDFVIKQAEHLYQYEQRNINTTKPLPSQYLKGNIINRDDIIVEGFERALNDLRIKLLGIKTEKVRRNNAQKLKEQIVKFRSGMNNKTLLDSIYDEVNGLLHKGDIDDGEVVEGEYVVIIDDTINKPDNQNSKDLVAINKDEISSTKHKARFVIFSDKNPSSIVTHVKLQLQVNLFTKVVEFVNIPMDDPSTIFKKLEVRRPLNTDQVPELPYYPCYAKMDPEQRWIYLNWLEDIRQKIDIGYAFIYYYGLERQLLTSNFNDSFDEINLLRKFHDNKSFILYSSAALLFTTIFKNELDKLKLIYQNPFIDKIGNDELLLNHFLGYDLSAKSLIQLAKSIKTINLRYYKTEPIAYEEVTNEQLNIRFQDPYFPFASKINLHDVPKIHKVIYANYSFPENIRSIDVPDFLSFEPFMAELHSLFNDIHSIMKSKFRVKIKN